MPVMNELLDFAMTDGLKLLLALVLGGAMGMERELTGKPAGLRTNLLIAVGAALLTIVSRHVGAESGDPGRIAAQVVTGVGFIGAGAIIQARGAVTGLTTAATIWAVAGVGIAAGSGAWQAAVLSTVIIISCLVSLRGMESRVRGRRSLARYSVTMLSGTDSMPAIDAVHSNPSIDAESLTVRVDELQRSVEITCVGSKKAHKELFRELCALDGVQHVQID